MNNCSTGAPEQKPVLIIKLNRAEVRLRISLDSKFLAYYNSNVANIYSLGGLSQPVVMPFSSGQVQQPQQPMR